MEMNPIFYKNKNLNVISASYGVEDPEFAITQLAQTTMRSELGKMTFLLLLMV